MSRRQSVRRGVAAVSSGALVVGAGAAVGVLAAQMSEAWSSQAAQEAAARQAVDLDPTTDLTALHPVVVTRIKERHVTPKPVVIHKRVIVRVPSGSAPRTSTSSGSSRVAAPAPRTASKPQPTRTVVKPAPAKPKPASGGSTPAKTTKTS